MTRHGPRIKFSSIQSAKKINDVTALHLGSLPQSLFRSVFSEFTEISAIGVDGILRKCLLDPQIVQERSNLRFHFLAFLFRSSSKDRIQTSNPPAETAPGSARRNIRNSSG